MDPPKVPIQNQNKEMQGQNQNKPMQNPNMPMKNPNSSVQNPNMPMQNGGTKNAPLGVKIISVLYYIGAGLFVIGAVALFFGVSFLSSFLSAFGIDSSILTAFSIVAGVVLLAFAALSFFIGRGLWNGQNWARILAIIFAILGVLSGIGTAVSDLNLTSGIISILVDGFIGWYLLFKGDVKEFFRK